MGAPTLYVIAGPNGIGKTTSDFDFIPGNIPVINSDEIAAEIRKSGQQIPNTQEVANGKASELISSYLDRKASFGFETNLCDVDTWKFLLEVQGQIMRLREKLPDWVIQYLGQKFTNEVEPETKTRDLSSVDEVRKRYLENNKKTESE